MNKKTYTKRIYTTNARCPRCNEYLRLSPVEDYVFYCEHCEEDFYGIEIKQVMGDWFEITIDMSKDEYNAMLESIKENFKDSCFIGYDDVFDMNVCDIGFDKIPSGKRVKDIVKYFNLIEK